MDKIGYDEDTRRALRLFVVLMRCTNAVSEQSRQDIVRAGLSTSEFAVLELLYHKGPTPLGAVAAQVLLTSGSMTYVIDQLEKQGLVMRVACPKDRRRLHAALTDAGQAKIAALFPGHAGADHAVPEHTVPRGTGRTHAPAQKTRSVPDRRKTGRTARRLTERRTGRRAKASP